MMKCLQEVVLLAIAAAPAAAATFEPTAATVEPTGGRPTYSPTRAPCSPAEVGPELDSVGIKATLIDTIPTSTTAAGTYNMQPVEGFADETLFVDHAYGKIFSFKPATTPIKIYDVRDGVPPGVSPISETLGHGMPYVPTTEQKYQIHSVAPGPNAGSVIVVFTSSTLPDGQAAPLVLLPSERDFRMFEDPQDCDLGNIAPVCDARTENITTSCCGSVPPPFGGMFREPRCCLAAKAYKLFYKFDFSDDRTALENPSLFFSLEQQITYGHQGGGMVTIPDGHGDDTGKVLFAVGDCLPFGFNGLEATQKEDNVCGKIILLDPANPGFNVISNIIVAKGVRNSQQMNVEDNNLVFVDMGALTAEEVNVVPLNDLLSNAEIENFGWGEDGKIRKDVWLWREEIETWVNKDVKFAREGTWAVGESQGLQFGAPECIGDLSPAEMSDMIQPYIQFGRSSGKMLFGITSSIMNSKSFDKIKLLATEYNTGSLIGTTEAYNPALGPRPVNFVELYNQSNALLPGGFNDLVATTLGVAESDSRSDMRLFKFPDGTAGAFIERTGQIYELEEFSLDESAIVTPPTVIAAPPSSQGVALTLLDGIPTAWSGGPGCPSDFASGADYDAHDVVSLSAGAYSMVYKCTSAPMNQFCGKVGYEPSSGQHWQLVWTSLGSCTGAMSPTASPAYSTLPDAGGCPGAWAAGTNYEEGDHVAVAGRVYTCKAWPLNMWCGQAGYEPGGDSTPWGEAWTVAGHCAGTITPTAAPALNPATVLAGCPEEWKSGGAVTYEEGDRVSVTVSATPLRQVAYQCKAWPLSGYCTQRAPMAFGGEMGWTLLGSCDGTITPTASPVFTALAEVSGGCPAAWNKAVTTYVEGDEVAKVVSIAPERKIVYACKGWPAMLFCNQGEAYAPGSTYGSMAWDLKGYCDGSIAPTAAPITFVGECIYTKIVVNAGAGAPITCSPGSTNCSCTMTAGITVCTRPTDTVTPTQVNVAEYRTGLAYDAADVVRVGTKRFKCKEYPFSLWCRMPAYAPTLQSDGIWRSAWTEDGTCAAPTGAPSPSPVAVTVTCLGATLAPVSATLAGEAAGTLSICTVTQGSLTSSALNLAATGLPPGSSGSIKLSVGTCAEVSTSQNDFPLGDYTTDSSGNGTAELDVGVTGVAGLLAVLFIGADPVACGVLRN